MKLRDLLEDLNYEILNEGPAGLDTDVADIVLDSRKTEPGILFTCIKGAVVDGFEATGRFFRDLSLGLAELLPLLIVVVVLLLILLPRMKKRRAAKKAKAAAAKTAPKSDADKE